jgi:hypothetical protein
MTQYNSLLSIRLPIPEIGQTIGVSLTALTVLEDGRHIESVVPVDPAELGRIGQQFSLDLVAERDALLTQVTTLTGERETLQSQADTIPGLTAQIAELTTEKAELEAEVARLTALVPPPVPDAFLSADWPRFRNLILSDEAVQRVAVGNPTAWPLMVLYLTQLSSTPSRGADIAALWTMLEANTPVTPEEVARINVIAEDCGVPLRMNEDGSIG